MEGILTNLESGVLGPQLVFYYIFTTEGSTITLLISASKASLGQL